MTFETEEEQIQQIKKWFKQYGLVIIIAIIIGLGGGFGWRYWHRHKNDQSIQASNLYEVMLVHYSDAGFKSAQPYALELIKSYSATPYAALASMLLAKQAVQVKDYAIAVKHLQWVIDNSSMPSMQQIARNRMARVLIADNKPKQAITTLNKVNDKAFTSAINEIKGDAYLALNNKKQALSMYKLALTTASKNAVNRPLLLMKYNKLAPISFNLATNKSHNV